MLPLVVLLAVRRAPAWHRPPDLHAACWSRRSGGARRRSHGRQGVRLYCRLPFAVEGQRRCRSGASASGVADAARPIDPACRRSSSSRSSPSSCSAKARWTSADLSLADGLSLATFGRRHRAPRHPAVRGESVRHRSRRADAGVALAAADASTCWWVRRSGLGLIAAGPAIVVPAHGGRLRPWRLAGPVAEPAAGARRQLLRSPRPAAAMLSAIFPRTRRSQQHRPRQQPAHRRQPARAARSSRPRSLPAVFIVLVTTGFLGASGARRRCAAGRGAASRSSPAASSSAAPQRSSISGAKIWDWWVVSRSGGSGFKARSNGL